VQIRSFHASKSRYGEPGILPLASRGIAASNSQTIRSFVAADRSGVDVTTCMILASADVIEPIRLINQNKDASDHI
jgi:hypothetical protein